MNSDDRVLSLKEAAAYLGLHEMGIWRLRKAPDFPRVVHLGKRRRGLVASELAAWVESRKEPKEAA